MVISAVAVSRLTAESPAATSRHRRVRRNNYRPAETAESSPFLRNGKEVATVTSEIV